MDAPTSRSRSRREERQGEQEEDIAMPHADGDAPVYSDVEDATDEELEVNGQRVRTRKGKLMRWYNDAESQRAPAYSYAYDYSHAHSGYHHQASYNHGSSTSISTSVSSRPQQHHQQQYSPVQTAVTTTNVLPALVHPVPRPHMGVVQSASNSPSGIYVRNLGYPGSAYPVHQHRPAASSTRGAPPSHQQPSHQQQSQQQQQPVSSWYSASYHPSPVQSKTYLAPLTQRDDRPTTAAYQQHYQHQQQQSTATLPNQHDDVWE
ncbi:hypothetical protein BKA70DRAFT_187967 [Coprinopsis sp. MPI-PUGE-AT-0042]|nr:hypothetical protein BKA70DRAFT_187967 [Coprinopsis sp. MPI-PUGE-AT-0042]